MPLEKLETGKETLKAKKTPFITKREKSKKRWYDQACEDTQGKKATI